MAFRFRGNRQRGVCSWRRIRQARRGNYFRFSGFGRLSTFMRGCCLGKGTVYLDSHQGQTPPALWAPGRTHPAALWGVWDDDYGKLNLVGISLYLTQDGSTVDIGTFDPDVKSYTGTVDSTVEYVTVTVAIPTGGV